jgi:hypothetical protein
MPNLISWLVPLVVIIIGMALKIMVRASKVELRPSDINIGGPLGIVSIMFWSNYLVKNIDKIAAQGSGWVFYSAIVCLLALAAVALLATRIVDELDAEIKTLLWKEREAEILGKQRLLLSDTPVKIDAMKRKQWQISLGCLALGLVCFAFNLMLK